MSRLTLEHPADEDDRTYSESLDAEAEARAEYLSMGNE